MVSDLLKAGVVVEAKPEEEPSLLMNIFVSWFPMLLLIGVWIFFMRQMQGGGKGGAFSFGKSKARLLDDTNNGVTFADVAGCDEAKEEVSELVDFLRDPGKFQKLGGRIPRGVLMVGSPGQAALDASELVSHWSVKKVEIKTDPELDIQVDGDVVTTTPQVIQVKPRALRVVV